MEASATRKFDVGGVLLDRPFRISRLGHFGYFSDHMKEFAEFLYQPARLPDLGPARFRAPRAGRA